MVSKNPLKLCQRYFWTRQRNPFISWNGWNALSALLLLFQRRRWNSGDLLNQYTKLFSRWGFLNSQSAVCFFAGFGASIQSRSIPRHTVLVCVFSLHSRCVSCFPAQGIISSINVAGGERFAKKMKENHFLGHNHPLLLSGGMQRELQQSRRQSHRPVSPAWKTNWRQKVNLFKV